MEPCSTFGPVEWSTVRQAVGDTYRRFTFSDSWREATVEDMTVMAERCRAWDGPSYWVPTPAQVARVIEDQISGVRYEWRNIGFPGHPEMRMVVASS
jgi:hypothetical protein